MVWAVEVRRAMAPEGRVADAVDTDMAVTAGEFVLGFSGPGTLEYSIPYASNTYNYNRDIEWNQSCVLEGEWECIESHCPLNPIYG